MTEAEFRDIVRETLGSYMAERGTFAVLEDSPRGSGTKVYYFDYREWGIAVDSTGLWDFMKGRGVLGEGTSLAEAIQNEEQKYSKTSYRLT